MAYYYQFKYNFSYHSLNRIRERLNRNDLNDSQLKSYCISLIETSTDRFTVKNILYVSANKDNLYFVIDELTHLVLTMTYISPGKMYNLLIDD